MNSSIKDEVKALQIGFKIRQIRQQKRLTLQDLAAATGLSKPLLSQIENDQVTPPLATLLRIAKAFNKSLHTFFEDPKDSNRCIIIRAHEHCQAEAGQPQANHDLSPYQYISLGSGKKNRHMEPFLIEFTADSSHPDLEVSHEGEEFIYLLQGQVRFHYAGEVRNLTAGDAVYYDSNYPHGFVRTGSEPARALAVLYSET